MSRIMESRRAIQYRITEMPEITGMSYWDAANDSKRAKWPAGTPRVLLVLNDHGIAYHLRGDGRGFDAVSDGIGARLKMYGEDSLTMIKDRAEVMARVRQHLPMCPDGDYQALVHASFEQEFREVAKALGLQPAHAGRI